MTGDVFWGIKKSDNHEARMVLTPWIGSAVDEAVRFEILKRHCRCLLLTVCNAKPVSNRAPTYHSFMAIFHRLHAFLSYCSLSRLESPIPIV